MYAVYLAWRAFEVIYDHDGAMVPGLTNRNGHRRSADGSRKWGGARVKTMELKEDAWLEPGAREAFEERKAFTKSRYLEPELVGDQLSADI